MNIHRQALSYRQICVGRLKRKDAEFFLALSTIKDVSILCLYLKDKQVSYKTDFEANLVFTKYLQVQMLLASISDDYRDLDLYKKFGLVPFECEEIIKGRRPYIDEGALQRSFDYIKGTYPILDLWNRIAEGSQILLEKIPINHHPMLNRILEYYTTPLLGAAAVLGIKTREFHFLPELQNILGLVLKRHFKNQHNLKGEVAEYVKVMKLIRALKSKGAMYVAA